MLNNDLLVTAAWATAGLGVGAGIRRLSVWLARLEELEPGHRPWQVYGPPLLAAALFAVFAFELGPRPVLLVRSLWIAVLVQIIFFDFEHRLILDRVQFPAMGLAVLLSFLTPGSSPSWSESLVAGVGTGLLFLLIAVIGSLIFHAEAMGFGDVKLAILMGLILGYLPPNLAVLRAVFYGVMLAGVISIALILVKLKSMKDTIAYGPFLAAGALVVLFQLGLPA